MKPLWKRLVVGVPSTLIVLIAFIGFLHTPSGRPLLARIGVGCPVKASPEDVERARLGAARATRGDEVSPARPALGFALDTTTLSDVRRWADRSHLSCEETRGGSLFRCHDVPTSSVGETGPKIDELAFGFTPSSKRLVNMTTLRQGLESSVAASEMYDVASSLQKQLGAPALASGSRSASYLGGGEMHTTMFAYRFADYLADVSATNMGHGIMLREHYMSAKDD